jgi:hypothetical protein
MKPIENPKNLPLPLFSKEGLRSDAEKSPFKKGGQRGVSLRLSYGLPLDSSTKFTYARIGQV